MICPCCNRKIVHLSKHHPIPKSLGGVETINTCGDCHSAIHGRYTNKTLKEKLYNLEKILADPDLQKTFKFLSKQDPARRFRTRRSKKKTRKRKDMIKTVEMFETTDGHQFRLKGDAERHQAIVDEDERQIYYMFNITVEQKFETNYEVETDKGLEAAKEAAILAVKSHLGNQVKLRNRDWDSWEPIGDLKVLGIEETD